jgi:hypothetical protein
MERDLIIPNISGMAQLGACKSPAAPRKARFHRASGRRAAESRLFFHWYIEIEMPKMKTK